MKKILVIICCFSLFLLSCQYKDVNVWKCHRIEDNAIRSAELPKWYEQGDTLEFWDSKGLYILDSIITTKKIVVY